MNDNGSITIMFLILFSFILIISMFIINISETQTSYNFAGDEALEHKYILESHYNYMMNKDIYKKHLDKFLADYLVNGKEESSKTYFTIEEDVVDNKASLVKLSLDGDENILKVIIINRYKNMEKALVAEFNVINPIFIENDGYIFYDDIGNEFKDDVLKFLYGLEDVEVMSEDLIITKGDIIIDSDTEFNGLMISIEGKVIVSDNNKLVLNGLLISKYKCEGDVKVYKDEKLIKKTGKVLPGFIEYSIKNKKILEALR